MLQIVVIIQISFKDIVYLQGQNYKISGVIIFKVLREEKIWRYCLIIVEFQICK